MEACERYVILLLTPVYDTMFARHWDQWMDPRRRSQLFALDVHRDPTTAAWHAKGSIRNLMRGTKLETPVGPLGEATDFSVSSNWVAFVAKDLHVPPAWHTKQQVFLVPIDGSKAPRQISSNNRHGWTGIPAISPNEDMVVFLQQDKDGFESDLKVLQTYSLHDGTLRTFHRDWDMSPTALTFSADGAWLYAVVTEDEQRPIYRMPVDGAHLGPRTALVTHGSVSNVVPLKHDRMVYTRSTLHHPNDVYLLHVDEDEERALRLTNFFRWSKAHRDIDLGPKPERFTYAGSNDVPMHGWILKPPSFTKAKELGEKLPLAVLIHGGPESDWNDGWSIRWNPATFAAAGFVVVTLDPSGSTGFGQALTDRILEHWGDRPLDDVMKGVHYVLDTKSYIDRDRVVAAGASFGGYMVNMLQGHNDEKLFKALVTHDGAFNTMAMAYSTDELYFAESEFGGVPWERPELLDKFSPHQFVHKWNTPHLIVHGGHDFRLSPAEGVSAFHALQRRGVPSRLLFFPEESHWVQETVNAVQWHHEVLGWLQQWSAPSDERTAPVPLVFQ